MNSLEVFDVKRCDNPDCLWSKYELQVGKTEVGDDGFQRIILISTLRCQCEAMVQHNTVEVMEFVLPDSEDVACLVDCD